MLTVTAVAAACLTVFSCAKDDSSDAKTDAPVFRATAEATTEHGGKVQYYNGRFLWQADDTEKMYDGAGNESVYAIDPTTAGSTTAAFNYVSGTVPGDGPYTALYPAAMWTNISTVVLPEVQRTPDGRLQGMPMHAVSPHFGMQFHHLCGVVRFRLQASSAVSISRIAVATDRNTNGSATVSGQGTSLSLSTPTGSNVTTLSCEVSQSIASQHDFYMYLPAGSYSTFRILFTAADGSVCMKTANSAITVERAQITTITLSGLTFTEHRFTSEYYGANSVVIAPGNLQYVGSASSPYWRFAARQYESLGTTTGQNSNNVNVDRDLFGWATSGWNNGNVFYHPYSTDTINRYRGVPNRRCNGWGYGRKDENGCSNGNLIEYSNQDWGVYNAISNGGNTAGQWRTPVSTEWDFILTDRDDAIRYAKGTVAGKVGLMVFPDGYSHPAGLTALASVNTASAAYSANQYSAAEWLQMEAAGAVFMPVTGRRDIRTVTMANDAYYWAANSAGEGPAYAFYFDQSTVYFSYTFKKYFGNAVRLVRD